MVFGIVKMMTARQQSLGGDASDIEAGSAQCSAHFDTGRFETQLSGLDRCDVSTRAAADDYYIVLRGWCGGGEGTDGRDGGAGADGGGR